jgi:hypothetical protein
MRALFCAILVTCLLSSAASTHAEGKPSLSAEIGAVIEAEGIDTAKKRFADVGPWWMRSATETVFTYSDSFTKFSTEFTGEGESTTLEHDLEGVHNPMRRLGPRCRNASPGAGSVTGFRTSGTDQPELPASTQFLDCGFAPASGAAAVAGFAVDHLDRPAPEEEFRPARPFAVLDEAPFHIGADPGVQAAVIAADDVNGPVSFVAHALCPVQPRPD